MMSLALAASRAHPSPTSHLVRRLFHCNGGTSYFNFIGKELKFNLHHRPVVTSSLTPCCHRKDLQIRSLHITPRLSENRNYEPDGKTTVSILNDEFGAPLMIDTYTQSGFKLNNGMKVLGPMIIFPRTVLGWDVAGIQDVSPESLALFALLEPKPDVLVIGVGTRGAKLSLDVVKYLRSMKINIEVLSTEHACTTFNFLSVEGRRCAGVMIPPDRITWTSQELADSKMRKRRLYDKEFDMNPFAKHPEETEDDKKKK